MAVKKDKDIDSLADEIDKIFESETTVETPSRTRSLLGAVPRGLMKFGAEAFKEIDQAMSQFPVIGKMYESAIESSAEIPTYEERYQRAEELFPIQDRMAERGLERFGKNIPYAYGMGPLEAILRTGGASLLGQGAEELGLPEWMQALAEIPAYAAPGFGKKIPAKSAAEAESMAYARKSGLDEKDIALLLEESGPVKEIAIDVAAKGGRLAKAFENTRQKLGRVWNIMKESPAAEKRLSEVDANKLVNDLTKKMSSEMPAEMRKRIETDFTDLVGSQMRGKDIIKFWQDLNYYIPKGERKLGILKEDLKAALRKIDPELANDFVLQNKLNSNFANLAKKVDPNFSEYLINAGEKGLLLHSIVDGNLTLLKKVLKPLAARQLAVEMVKNPRFQRLGQRFVNAAKGNKAQIAQKVMNQIVIEVGKVNQDAAQMLSNFDVNGLIEELSEED